MKIGKCSLALAALALFAQPTIKKIPADGIAVPDADRAELAAALAHLQASAAKLKGNPILADVLIFSEAVRFSLDYNEFFKPTEIAAAKTLLKQGEERAALLAAGKSPWTTATGLVVRGYVSRIDKSVQPYGLVIPADLNPNAGHRLDLWFHGRDETLTQVNFLTARQKNAGEFQPPDTIVLHLYGRYCNASKFAGEVDAFEAMDAVKRAYPIDENRILVRGFSMGGASVWHMAAHHAGLWAAAAPGAGFAESQQYLKIKLTGDNAPPWWEQKLWHYYDATDYAANLFNVPVIEYHGEIDPQKQAGDVMERAMAAEGLKLERIEGPQTAHKYELNAKAELARRIDETAGRGRDPDPGKIRFTTFTLTYNQMKWITIDALEHHWERARVDVDGDKVTTSNVAALTLTRTGRFTIDGQALQPKSWPAHFRKVDCKWAVIAYDRIPGLHKVHGLQGPIDDAFLDSFLFVNPTGKPASPAVAKWVASEETRAIGEWHRQFRGDAQVRNDRDITDADIANNNLILWGDPGSNRILARIADKLPKRWPTEASQALIMIYPNPLNPKKYVVVNSGFTFREADYLSNARQTPKLPDWAVVDTSVPADGRFPGKILDAGFFDEDWK
jgi:poly(3-hydroxybutyrate) depolymerase